MQAVVAAAGFGVEIVAAPTAANGGLERGAEPIAVVAQWFIAIGDVGERIVQSAGEQAFVGGFNHLGQLVPRILGQTIDLE